MQKCPGAGKSIGVRTVETSKLRRLSSRTERLRQGAGDAQVLNRAYRECFLRVFEPWRDNLFFHFKSYVLKCYSIRMLTNPSQALRAIPLLMPCCAPQRRVAQELRGAAPDRTGAHRPRECALVAEISSVEAPLTAPFTRRADHRARPDPGRIRTRRARALRVDKCERVILTQP